MLIGTIVVLLAGAEHLVGEAAGVSEATAVSVNGLGPIRIGLTVSQAARASGLELIPEHDPLDPDELDCYYVTPRAGLPGVTFMIADGKIARVDISNPSIRRLSGARIGMTEAEVSHIYAGRVEITEHQYDPAGHYMTVYPHRRRQIVFETDGKHVTDFRVGKVPEVGYVERCL
jgi:hypothetical protein